MRKSWIVLSVALTSAGALLLHRGKDNEHARGLEKPAEAVAERETAPADEVPLPAPSPAEKPAPVAALEPPAVEPMEIIETMTKEELTADVAHIDDELQRRDAMRRLNADAVNQGERAELGALIERASLMRTQLVKFQLADLERDFSEYAKGHAERVSQYVPRKK